MAKTPTIASGEKILDVLNVRSWRAILISDRGFWLTNLQARKKLPSVWRNSKNILTIHH